MKYFINLKQTILFSVLLIMGIVSISCNAETNIESPQSFSIFWKEFRQPLLNNDMPRILEMTKFPFKVKGDLDMDGSKFLNKNEFKKQFNSFMEQDIREDLTPESMRQYIKKNKSIFPKIDDGQTNIALFSFELIDGKWCFVSAYIEDL